MKARDLLTDMNWTLEPTGETEPHRKAALAELDIAEALCALALEVRQFILWGKLEDFDAASWAERYDALEKRLSR